MSRFFLLSLFYGLTEKNLADITLNNEKFGYKNYFKLNKQLFYSIYLLEIS